MSKPDWTALADRYGAQPADYNAPALDADCLACGREHGAGLCEECLAVERGEMPPDTIISFAPFPAPPDYLGIARANQDAGAAQDGQASIALALSAWLALLVAALVVVACVYGAAWINGVWLAPFAGLAR